MKALFTIFTALMLTACSGSRPDNLGHVNSLLTPCPDKPNCVTSLVEKSDEHYIDALTFDNKTTTKNKLQEIIQNTENTKVIVNSEHYIYAEYTSDLMGFVDDVEFLFDDQSQLIHVRSASRLGYRDFDVNRDRIEDIRRKLTL